ncbi:hypothetical protein [Heyndrickxia coagulans]|uniref:hypothetical protein n=1 Tax=Heyndrickxia coagulans TaxID=1398 RepID=UPI0007791831|nr:hypothetical protein [Heyndrickxia coagulans]KYC67162.1 hypothetical protein B4100_3798 [Heyndrickxia coagulans]
MGKQVYRFGEDGSFLEPVIIEPDATIPDDCTDVELPQPCYEPRFNRDTGAWEDITREEWLAKQPQQPREKTETEKLEMMQKALDDLILGGDA